MHQIAFGGRATTDPIAILGREGKRREWKRRKEEGKEGEGSGEKETGGEGRGVERRGEKGEGIGTHFLYKNPGSATALRILYVYATVSN